LNGKPSYGTGFCRGSETDSADTGKVLFGLDWGLTDRNSTFREDTVYYLRTDDGANIMVRAQGQGVNVHHSFDVANEKYTWLNNVVGYALGLPADAGVSLEVWQVNTSILVEHHTVVLLMRRNP
jgi:Protein of unknown function (DUF3237)